MSGPRARQEMTLTPIKTLLAATVAVTALMSSPMPVQAQSGDPLLRFLNQLVPNFQGRMASRNWNDDDDDRRGGRDDDDDGRDDDDDDGRDDDDDDGRGGRDDDDDNGGGGNDDDD